MCEDTKARIRVLDAPVGTPDRIVAKHQKPRTMTRHWVQYSIGAVGISVFSAWLISHSRLAGSSDIDNWIRHAKHSVAGFLSHHAEQLLIGIRDELFETFRKRHKGVMELEEVQLTSNSLHRMLLAFSEQTKGQKFLENASDQEMLEIVMGRYEKELRHPIQNLLGGELARVMLIQIQKLKLDIETATLELNKILRTNKCISVTRIFMENNVDIQNKGVEKLETNGSIFEDRDMIRDPQIF